jgi:hypothetical protein
LKDISSSSIHKNDWCGKCRSVNEPGASLASSSIS